MKNLVGNTYPIKEKIKSMGGRWNATENCWSVPENCYDELKAMISSEVKLNLGGQLWEECEICGHEPIYTNYMVCERCAKKGYKR